jgi:predicted negative regulator of RcsB-dependent stress response
MSEPRLEDIEDYNTLKGEKKKIVLAVILAGVLMGVVYIFAYKVFDNKEDNLPVEQSINKIPMK